MYTLLILFLYLLLLLPLLLLPYSTSHIAALFTDILIADGATGTRTKLNDVSNILGGELRIISRYIRSLKKPGMLFIRHIWRLCKYTGLVNRLGSADANDGLPLRLFHYIAHKIGVLIPYWQC